MNNQPLIKMYKLTNQQESMIASMFFTERVLGRKLWFSSAFFTSMLGMVWNTYYRQLLEDLCTLGWMERMFRGGAWWYTLLEPARVNRDECLNFAMRGVRLAITVDRNQLTLPGMLPVDIADNDKYLDVGLDTEPPF